MKRQEMGLEFKNVTEKNGDDDQTATERVKASIIICINTVNLGDAAITA